MAVGQTRVINRFLLFPLKLNGQVRWLERAKIKQIVVDMDVGGSMEWGNYKKVWRDYEWKEK